MASPRRCSVAARTGRPYSYLAMAIDLSKLLERTFIGNRVTDATGEVLGTVVKEGAYWVLVERVVVESAEFEAFGPGWIRIRQAKLPAVEGAESASLVPEEQKQLPGR